MFVAGANVQMRALWSVIRTTGAVSVANRMGSMNAPRERGLLGVRSSLLVRFICIYIVLKQCRETTVCSIRVTGPSGLLGPEYWVPEIPRGIPLRR